MTGIDTLYHYALIGLAVLTACGGDGVPDGPITYADHVAPILDRHCASCHRPDGSAPFSLLDYENARRWAPAIKSLTQTRSMPPWLPEPGRGEFVGARRLSERDMAIISAWVDGGAAVGELDRRPAPPTFADAWDMGTPDLVLEMPEAYRLEPGERDVFRYFVLPVPLEETRYVRAVDLKPGSRHIVHHAVMQVDRTGSSRRLDAADEEPGFSGMFVAAQAESPDGFFLGWTPGRVPDEGDDDLAWRLEPGSDFTVQLHLRPSSEPQHVRVRVGLYFADRPPTRHPYVITLGSQSMNIPPGEAEYRVRDTYTLPVPVEVLSVYPHTHYIGKEVRGFAELPDGSTRWLIHIRDWDFNWQDAYRYAEPVSLPAGATLVMEISFDNSSANPRNPFDPPRRIVYGPETTDEMANIFLRVLPQDSAARATLDRDFSLEYVREEIEGHRFRLGLNPNDAETRTRLGTRLQSVGQIDEAIAEYRRAIADGPEYGLAHFNLGTALEQRRDLNGAKAAFRRAASLDVRDPRARYNLGNILFDEGRFAEAAEAYRAAVAIDPRHAGAHTNLGNALRALGRPDAAMAQYRRAVEVDPRHADAYNNLGNLLRERGATAEALAAYRDAARAQPDFALARFNLGRLLELEGDLAGAVTEYRAAVRAAPSWPVPMVSLSWILATSRDRTLRSPTEAMDLAERAARLTDGGHPVVLDQLAVAYASLGDFQRAVPAAQRALELAQAAGDEAFARMVAGRIAMYRRGQAVTVPN